MRGSREFGTKPAVMSTNLRPAVGRTRQIEYKTLIYRS
jgi:hypothetical protein